MCVQLVGGPVIYLEAVEARLLSAGHTPARTTNSSSDRCDAYLVYCDDPGWDLAMDLRTELQNRAEAIRVLRNMQLE